MPKYDKIIAYIPYFEKENPDFCRWTSGQDSADGILVLPYPEYERQFTRFIDEVHIANLMNGDYFSILNERIPDKNYKAAISTADLELLSAILTFYIRSERYCDGAWENAYQDKIFIKLISRLQEIVETNKKLG